MLLPIGQITILLSLLMAESFISHLGATKNADGRRDNPLHWTPYVLSGAWKWEVPRKLYGTTVEKS